MKMLKQTYRWMAAASAAALVVGSGAVWAAVAQTPLFLVAGAKPRVMLAMSVDHQLFKKAYPDYNDLNNDGVVDITYTDSFDYDGYFNSDACYEYSSGKFEPEGPAGGANGHDCTASDEWSGNFLNWATMTRIDVLRKVMYGGQRSTDTASTTVLERAHLPSDVHAFAKGYIAGEALSDAVKTTRDLNRRGMMATIDILGEFIKTREEATFFKEIGRAHV